MKKLMDGNEGIVASKEEASKSGESAIKRPREKGRRRGGGGGEEGKGIIIKKEQRDRRKERVC